LVFDFSTRRPKKKRDAYTLDENPNLATKLKVDSDCIDHDMSLSSFPRTTRARHSDASNKPKENDQAKPKHSFVQQISKDWDDDAEEDSGEDEEEVEEKKKEEVVEPPAKRPRTAKKAAKPKKKAKDTQAENIDDDVVTQAIQKIPKIRDATSSGRNVKIVKKTVGMYT
jgi:hypothetical protein